MADLTNFTNRPNKGHFLLIFGGGGRPTTRICMPQYYNEAARLLLTLTQFGVTIAPGLDARTIVHRIAVIIQLYLKNMPTMSHAGAARWILDEITKNNEIRYSGNADRLIALIGTVLGNLQASSPARGP